MDSEARKRQIMVWYTLAAVLGVLLLQYFIASYSEVETIPYSQFEQLLNADKIAEVTVKTDSIQGRLVDALPSGKKAFLRRSATCGKARRTWGSRQRRAVRRHN